MTSMNGAGMTFGFSRFGLRLGAVELCFVGGFVGVWRGRLGPKP